ncbi:hypothetical protein [Streptomyces mirabilis]|uniref:hypothetical protein n=1 Tax=Streptomyces mirabilis TaxID=68239 RepID=UPI0036DCC78D
MTTATDLSDIDSMSFDPHSARLVEAFRDALVRMREGEDLTVEDLDTAADLLRKVQAAKGDFLAAEVIPLFREVFQGGLPGRSGRRHQPRRANGPSHVQPGNLPIRPDDTGTQVVVTVCRQRPSTPL